MTSQTSNAVLKSDRQSESQSSRLWLLEPQAPDAIYVYIFFHN